MMQERIVVDVVAGGQQEDHQHTGTMSSLTTTVFVVEDRSQGKLTAAGEAEAAAQEESVGPAVPEAHAEGEAGLTDKPGPAAEAYQAAGAAGVEQQQTTSGAELVSSPVVDKENQQIGDLCRPPERDHHQVQVQPQSQSYSNMEGRRGAQDHGQSHGTGSGHEDPHRLLGPSTAGPHRTMGSGRGGRRASRTRAAQVPRFQSTDIRTRQDNLAPRTGRGSRTPTGPRRPGMRSVPAGTTRAQNLSMTAWLGLPAAQGRGQRGHTTGCRTTRQGRRTSTAGRAGQTG